MSGFRRFVNLGMLDCRREAAGLYNLRRLDLSKVDLFYRTAQEAAAHANVVPTLTLAEAMAPKRKCACKVDLAAAAAMPKIQPPQAVVAAPPPVHSSYALGDRDIHFFATASENKVVFADREKRIFHFDADDAAPCPMVTEMPSLNAHKHSPLAISVPPTPSQLDDGQVAGDLYITDSDLNLDKGDARPQFEALVWRDYGPSLPTGRCWHCDILPPPPFIARERHIFPLSPFMDHRKRAFICGHAVVGGGDTICFSITDFRGLAGTYCFHTATREWSKAGDWLMPFDGKAEYASELGLWFGISRGLPCAVDLSGVVRGVEPLPDKTRIWVNDDIPDEWYWSYMSGAKVGVINIGSGRFVVSEFFDTKVFDKDFNEMVVNDRFAVFTGMDVVYDKGNDNGNGNDNSDINVNGNGNDNNDNNSNDGNTNNDSNCKGKGKRGLHMIKHKSSRYMLGFDNIITAVL